MEREELREAEFVQQISALWREQKRREFLYLLALKKDKMGPLRKMLSQGHFSALLFQREIRAVYDYFKCFMTDKELDNSVSASEISESSLHNMEEKEQVAGYLKKMESKILTSYKSLHKYVERDSETKRIIDEHLRRISEFYEVLSKQELVARKEMKSVLN